jgi:hypothetical protein
VQIGAQGGTRALPSLAHPFQEEVNEMEIKLSEIVKYNYYYDLHSGCVEGLELPDIEVCTKCATDAHTEIVR